MQIRTLEAYVRVPLFRRGARTIALSAEGALLLPGVRRGLGELQQAVQQLRQDRSGGALNISTVASFLEKWLLPRLPQFHDRHPNIDLSIHTSRAAVDFSEGNFHAAVRMSTAPTPGVYNEKLLDEWFLPVCSPELLARLGPLRTSADLKRYPLLRSADESWTCGCAREPRWTGANAARLSTTPSPYLPQPSKVRVWRWPAGRWSRGTSPPDASCARAKRWCPAPDPIISYVPRVISRCRKCSTCSNGCARAPPLSQGRTARTLRSGTPQRVSRVLRGAQAQHGARP